MNKQKIGMYLKLCKEAGINNTIAVRQLEKYAFDPPWGPTKIPAKSFVTIVKKPGILAKATRLASKVKNPKIAISAALTALILSFGSGILVGGKDDNTKPSIQKDPKPKSDTNSDLGTGTVLGGLGGAGLGAYYGPDILTSMEPDTARLIGGVGGGLVGAFGGSLLSKESTLGQKICQIT